MLLHIAFSRVTLTSLRVTFTSFLHISHISSSFMVPNRSAASRKLQASFKQASSKFLKCLLYSCLFGLKFILGLFYQDHILVPEQTCRFSYAILLGPRFLIFYPRANAPAGLGFAFCRRRRDLSKTVFCSHCHRDLSKNWFLQTIYT